MRASETFANLQEFQLSFFFKTSVLLFYPIQEIQ